MRLNAQGASREGMTDRPKKTGAGSERGAVPTAQSRLQAINYAKMQQVSRKFECLTEL
jgi:hypothetical protein